MQIQEFFETMPKLQHTVKVMNPNTGVENEIVLEGLASFSLACSSCQIFQLLL